MREVELNLLEALDFDLCIPTSFEISYYLMNTSMRGLQDEEMLYLLQKAYVLCKAFLLGKLFLTKDSSSCSLNSMDRALLASSLAIEDCLGDHANRFYLTRVL